MLYNIAQLDSKVGEMAHVPVTMVTIFSRLEKTNGYFRFLFFIFAICTILYTGLRFYRRRRGLGINCMTLFVLPLNLLLCIDSLLLDGGPHVSLLWMLCCPRFWIFLMPRISFRVEIL